MRVGAHRVISAKTHRKAGAFPRGGGRRWVPGHRIRAGCRVVAQI